MNTPLDRRGYVMSEADNRKRVYRLILGFETLEELQAAHQYVVDLKKPSPSQETFSGGGDG